MRVDFFDSDLHCPKCHKRMVMDLGQDDDGFHIATHECLSCGYSETDRTRDFRDVREPIKITKEQKMGFWDDPDIKSDVSEFMSWDKPGDYVSGVIKGMQTRTFPASKDGEEEQTVPQLSIAMDEGGGITVSCGNWQLKKQLLELRPEVGDHISISYTGKQGRSKLFSVKVRRAGTPSSVDRARPVHADPWAEGGTTEEAPF